MSSSLSGLRVVLVGPRNPLNIGAAARAMSNFGISDLHLVAPYDLAFKEARSAVNAGYILERAQVYECLSGALVDCAFVIGTTAAANRDLHVPLYRLEAAATLIKAHLAQATRVGLVFGSEKFGLSNESISHCQALLRIPTREEHGSMNLGQAVAICLYELTRDCEKARKLFPPAAGARADAQEQITRLLVEVLEESGYINERTSLSTILKLRRLVKRLGLPASDVETWLGIFRQILWKTRGGNPKD